MTNLINNCIVKRVFPDIFKHAVVIPIAKSSNAKSADDFRPISLINNLAKVFERIIQKQLNRHLKKEKLLSSCQSGFRNGHSCETLLLKVTESWKKSIDEKNVIAVAFLNLKKAFDGVHHGMLLEKLRPEVGVE